MVLVTGRARLLVRIAELLQTGTSRENTVTSAVATSSVTPGPGRRGNLTDNQELAYSCEHLQYCTQRRSRNNFSLIDRHLARNEGGLTPPVSHSLTRPALRQARLALVPPMRR